MNRRQDLKQHFTLAKEINSLMCDLLGPVDGLRILEPSVGHGAFLGGLKGNPSIIEAIDVDPLAIETTRIAFPHLPLHLRCLDFIDAFLGDMFSSDHNVANESFDAVISNPPYGLYLEKSYRAKLKKALPGFYVRESFGLFFLFSITTLKRGGRYVFLLPDTFLSSKNHEPLRKFIVEEAAPTTIVRFPSKKFESVKFGYGNLCIIAGERRPIRAEDTVSWFDGCRDTAKPLELRSVEAGASVKGRKLTDGIAAGWSSSTFASTKVMLSGWTTLGEIAECRTGIYSGDNVKYIGYDSTRITKRVNGHAICWSRDVLEHEPTDHEKLYGIKGPQRYVPLIRGGHRNAFEATPYGIDWTEAAVQSYKRGKARFQNVRFYFRPGLSVPMVSTRRISAALMDRAVFDQGVVGLFPLSVEQTSPLFLYLNSSLASRLMKDLVNGSANNSANYLKRLPAPVFTSEHCKRAATAIETARRNMQLPHDLCDDFMESCKITTLNMKSDRDADFSEIEERRGTSRFASQ